MTTEVVRRLTLKAESTGIDEQTGKLKKLSDASNVLATVTDINAKRALSAEAAVTKLNISIDSAAASQAKITSGTRTLNAALAQGVITQDEYNRSLGLLKEKYTEVEGAGEGVSEGFKSTGIEAASVANHIKQAAAAAYALSPAFRALVNPAIAAGFSATGTALAAMSPYAAALAVNLASRVLPLLSQVAAFALPFALLQAEIKLVGYAWTSAGDQIEKYSQLSKDAATLGVTPEYLQRLGKSFESAGGKISDATELLKKFNEASQGKLGGSDLQKKVDANIEFGNLPKGSGAGLAGAVGSADQMRATVDLINKLLAANKDLAAIDLSQTAFGTAATDKLRQNRDYFTELLANADKIAATKLVSDQDINDAVALKNRYDEAVKILSERWIPFQETITAGGMLLQRTWVGIVETIASAVTGISNFAIKIGEIIGSIPGLVTGLKAVGSAAVNMIPGVAVGRAAVNYLSGPASTPTDDARSRLAAGLSNPNTRATQREQTNGISNLLRPDRSKDTKTATAAIQAQADTVDRLLNSLQKHILVQEADAKAVGLGVGALAALRAEAQHTAAVQANGGKETKEQAESFAKLKVSAENAAIALEKARIASDISRDKQMAFFTPEDVSIANQLKGLYGDDIPKAMNSSEAAAIRMNNTMKNIGDTVRDAAKSFTKDLVSGLMKGEGLMKSLQGAAKNLSSSLMDGAINDLFSGNFISAGIKGVGSIIAGIIGSSSDEDEENAKRAQEAAAKAAAALKDLQDRTKRYIEMAATATLDTDTIAGQIAQFDIQAQQMRAEEAEKGNGAIIELENALAKQRQAIIDKSNKAIAKSMNDFLDSLKTGSNSILSPEDQLKYAQAQFDRDVIAANGGDEAALARVTTNAQRLLDIAQSFYASGSGYTDIYRGVTDAISGLAGRNNIQVAALAPNTAKAPVDPMEEAWARMRKMTEMNPLNIEGAGPALTGTGMALGGIVGNGRYNVDSVLASYAGGGNIKLAGGEHVTRATSVNSATRASLDFINRTGKTPGNDNAEVVRVLTQGFNGLAMSLGEKLDNVAERVKRLEDTTRTTSNQRRVPGSQKAA